MSIRVVCRCGEPFEAEDRDAGGTVSCPVCERDVLVPDEDEDTSAVTPRRRRRLRVEDDSDDDRPLPQPKVKLFSTGAVTLAGFVSPLLGGWVVLAINDWRLGRRVRPWLLLLPGLFAAAVLVAVFLRLPPPFRSVVDSEWTVRLGMMCMGLVAVHTPVPAGLAALVVALLSRGLHGTHYDFHLRRQGPKASTWAALGLAALCAPPPLITLLGGLYLSSEVFTEGLGQELTLPTGQKVYYTGAVTPAEAQRLAEVLQTAGYFRGKNGFAVQVTREGRRVLVSCPVGDGAWERPDVLATYADLRATLRQSIFRDEPVAVRLCDEHWAIKKQLG